MKKGFESAAELFRRNEALAANSGNSSDQEKADCYRAFVLVAEGLQRMEKQLELLQSQLANGSGRAANGARFKTRPHILIAASTVNGQ